MTGGGRPSEADVPAAFHPLRSGEVPQARR